MSKFNPFAVRKSVIVMDDPNGDKIFPILCGKCYKGTKDCECSKEEKADE
jgi:hypothetical protein